MITRASNLQAGNPLRNAAFRVICTTSASTPLSPKTSVDADLGHLSEVRMVWWGFRALKTPERTSTLPTL